MLDTIEYINKTYEFNNLFLCNADKWWSYYETIKKELSLNYTLNLLEEGLTTYIVSSDSSYQEETINPITLKDIKKSFSELLKSLRKLFKYIKVTFVKLAVIFLNFISILFKTNIVRNLKKFILQKSLDKKYEFNYIEHFDNAVVCFPEKIEQINFSIDKIQRLNFELNEIDKKQYPYSFNENYTLFINQKYINYTKHFEILFKIFAEMDINNIYIKLHPKENKEIATNEINKCLKKYDNINVEIITNLDSIPIEDIIYSFKFKEIIGLTSSALMYCNEFIENLNIISIATRYRQMCYDKSNNINIKELNMFEKEYKNFLKFSKLEQYSYKNKIERKD